jgi:hypothetical protein
LLIAPDREQCAAETHVVPDDIADRHHENQEECGCRNLDPLADGKTEVRDRIVPWMRNSHRLGIQPESRAACEEHAGERDQKRRQSKNMNQGSHACAQRRSNQHCQRPDHAGMQTASGHQRRGENRRESNDCTDRKIDSTRENHQRHSDRRDAEKCIVGEKIHDHAGREKSVVGNRGGDKQCDENDCRRHKW